MLKGITHCHSTYSDGEYPLADLREVLISAGCSFACMADHAEWFDSEKLRAYMAECEALSDSRFRFVAGLEYNCERRTHILGYGVTSLVLTTDPQEVIRHIEHEGGISVIAHPSDASFPSIAAFETLPHGIETWNTKSDGRYAPRPGPFRLLRRLQQRAPRMRAFYGVDLHWTKQFRGLYTLLRCESLHRDDILVALGRGDYVGVKGDLHLPSDGDVPEARLEEFGKINQRSVRLRQIITSTKGVAARFGARLPTPIKAQVRRIF
jgi:hypothetical protein